MTAAVKPTISKRSKVFGERFVLGVISRPASDDAAPEIAQLKVRTDLIRTPLSRVTSGFSALARIASPIPVLVKKSVVKSKVIKTIPITKRSNAVNARVEVPNFMPFVLTGDGKPRSSPAQIIPASALRIPSTPSDAMTGIVVRIDSLANIADFLRPDNGRIIPKSTIEPRMAPAKSAITNAIQYEYLCIINCEAM